MICSLWEASLARRDYKLLVVQDVCSEGSWASECPDFDQHWVPCCSGGKGAFEGRFGNEDVRLLVDSDGGWV